MTTLLQRHTAKLEAAEGAEAAVYRAGLAWAPAGKVAAEAGQKMATASGRVGAAEVELNRILREIADRDREFGNELARLHSAGKLNREAIGEGGGQMVKNVLAAEAALGKAREECAKATRESSDAHVKANQLFRDVLQALQVLQTHAQFGVVDGVNRVFQEAQKNPDQVADSCKTRLGVLGVKA
jgi:hypothetical protein